MTLEHIMNEIEYNYGFVPEEFGTDKTFEDFTNAELKEMYLKFLKTSLNESNDEDLQETLNELERINV